MYIASGDLEQDIISLATNTVLIASLVLIGTATIAVLLSKKNPKQFKKLKIPLFFVLAASLIGTTLLLFISTVYLNIKAESKGPVHWHADIEFWACGAEVELRDPTGTLSNKIGTATFHEHNDKRLHLEGVVVSKAHDASLSKFMEVSGGYINKTSIGIPLNADGQRTATAEHQDGDVTYPDHFSPLEKYISHDTQKPVLELTNRVNGCNGQPAELQTFVYHTNAADNTFTQTKLSDPSSYVMRGEATVPPGDCVIIEYDVPKVRTGKLCQQLGVRDDKRCEEFGVHKYDPKICLMHEVSAEGEDI